MWFWVVKKRDNSFHVVSMDTSEGMGYTCTCSQFIFRQKECKHIRMVKGLEFDKEYEIVFI